MNATQLRVQKEALGDMLARLDEITVSCGTCERFVNGACSLCDAVPPQDVQIVGCDKWLFNGIPF